MQLYMEYSIVLNLNFQLVFTSIQVHNRYVYKDLVSHNCIKLIQSSNFTVVSTGIAIEMIISFVNKLKKNQLYFFHFSMDSFYLSLFPYHIGQYIQDDIEQKWQEQGSLKDIVQSFTIKYISYRFIFQMYNVNLKKFQSIPILLIIF